MERGHKNDDPDAGKRDTPLSGKVGDDCVRDVAKTPVEQGKPRVNPFFQDAADRGSFRGKDLQEKAAKMQALQESIDTEIPRKDFHEIPERWKERGSDRGGEHFHAF